MAAAPAPSASARGGALGGSNPNPNANGPKLRSPQGKPVPLADITNTGRPNPSRSINFADVLKENAKLLHLLERSSRSAESRCTSSGWHCKLRANRTCISRRPILRYLRVAHCLIHLCVLCFQELNLGKDRLKALQHELSCTTAMLKVKASELERKNNTANQLQKEVNSQVIKAIPSELATVEAHQIDKKATSADAHHLVETQSTVPSNTGRQEPQDKTNKRGTKRKSESCEGTKNTNIAQHHYKLRLQSVGSLRHEDPRKPLRRRSTRLNPGSCEVTEVSCETLHEDTVVPSAPSSCSVPNLHEPSTGKDMGKLGKSLQNELPCNATVHKVKASDLKEIQEACSRLAGVEAHQIDDKASDTNQNHLAATQSSLPFNIEHPEPPQERGNKRGANKQKLESCEGLKDSNIQEDNNAKCHSYSSKPLHHEEKMKSQRRKSSRLNPGSCEVIKGTFETLHEDVIVPLGPSSSNVLIEQRKNEKQNNGCSLMKSSKEQATGRSSAVARPLRWAAEKIVSYKEIPLNVKMRRA